MDVVNYREDEEIFQEVLRELANGSGQFNLASGYLNLQKEYMNELFATLAKDSELKVNFLTASPKANGFYRAGMVKKHIPGVYRVNEEKLLSHHNPNLKMFEYAQEGWTFHAKGAWAYDQGTTDKVAMSVVGSSNFSYRSNRRDTECQFYVVSECEQF